MPRKKPNIVARDFIIQDCSMGVEGQIGLTNLLYIIEGKPNMYLDRCLSDRSVDGRSLYYEVDKNNVVLIDGCQRCDHFLRKT